MKSPFKTLDEFYKATDNLIDSLNAEKHTDDAAKLKGLLHHTAWTTAAELPGELQFVLKDMKGKYSADIGREINDCLAFTAHHRKILGL